METSGITPEKFKAILPDICDQETTLDPDGWSNDNPLWGHCAVVSLLAQDLFGGELVRASLKGTEFEEMRSHYWNRFPDGTELDFTEDQFCGRRPEGLETATRKREYLLSYESTVKRYKLLSKRFQKACGKTNG